MGGDENGKKEIVGDYLSREESELIAYNNLNLCIIIFILLDKQCIITPCLCVCSEIHFIGSEIKLMRKNEA